MILFALVCEAGHGFDSWFRDGHAFEEQAAGGHVTCPVCRSPQVGKAVMAPAVVGSKRAAVAVAQEPSEPAAKPVTPLDESGRELRDMVRKMRRRLEAEGHDVGRAFAAEARRIHDGEAPARQIYGEASLAEARDLLDEGIMVLPLPLVPDELN